jgi:hypothetical protein
MAQVPGSTATDDAEWRSIDDQLQTWAEPTELIGIYRGAETVAGKFGAKRRHTLDTNNGRVSFFAPAMLDRLLSNARPGERIRIRYAGQTVMSASGQPVKKFVVERRETPVASANSPADEATVPF